MKLLCRHELIKVLQSLIQFLLGAIAFLHGLHLIRDLLRRNFGAKADLDDWVFSVKSCDELVIACNTLATNLFK